MLTQPFVQAVEQPTTPRHIRSCVSSLHSTIDKLQTTHTTPGGAVPCPEQSSGSASSDQRLPVENTRVTSAINIINTEKSLWCHRHHCLGLTSGIRPVESLLQHSQNVYLWRCSKVVQPSSDLHRNGSTVDRHRRQKVINVYPNIGPIKDVGLMGQLKARV